MMIFFQVTLKKSIVLKLKLSQIIKSHNVFHPNFVQKVQKNISKSEINTPTSRIIINNEKKWEVKNIFDVRSFPGKFIFG